MTKVLPQSSHGGKREGAGRKVDPNSRRQRSIKYHTSVYLMKQAEFVRSVSPKLFQRVYTGELKLYRACQMAAAESVIREE